MKRFPSHSAVLFLLLFAFPASNLKAQTDPNIEQGLKPFGSYHGGNIDSINMTNGHLTVRAPFYSLPQRGKLNVSFSIFYDNNGFVRQPYNCVPHGLCTHRVVWKGSGVKLIYDQGLKVKSQQVNSGQTGNGQPIMIPVLLVVAPDQSQHQLALLTTSNTTYETIDSTGIRYDSNFTDIYGVSGTMTDGNGIRYPLPPSGTGTVVLAEDPNGNQISYNNSTFAFVDTLGRSVPDPNGGLASGNLSNCPQLSFSYQSATSAALWNLPAPNGGTMAVTVCSTSVFIRTSLCQGSLNCSEYVNSQTLIQSIVLPNGRYWAFQYDAANPNDGTSIGYGNLLQVILPTGASISYSLPLFQDGCIYDPASDTRVFRHTVSTRSVDAHDGTGAHTWTYTWGTVNSVTDPLGQKTVHTFTGLSSTCSYYETQTQFYDSSSNLLKTVNTDYSFQANPFADMEGTSLVASVVPIRATTTWPNGNVTKNETDYDAGFSFRDPTYFCYINPGCPSDFVVDFSTYTGTTENRSPSVSTTTAPTRLGHSFARPTVPISGKAIQITSPSTSSI